MDMKSVLKINRSSDDIWKLLKIAVDTKNWALIEKNLDRLHALQRHYCEILTTQSGLNQVLEADNAYLRAKTNQLEDENLLLICKDKGFPYKELQKKLDGLYKEI